MSAVRMLHFFQKIDYMAVIIIMSILGIKQIFSTLNH